MTRSGLFFLLFALVMMPFFLVAQNITNLTYKLLGNKIEVTYTLAGKASDRYRVALYNSIDRYATPVKLVTGDVGDDITPGANKKIIWNAKKELGEFKGGLALKLKTLFIPFITFSMAEGEKFVMGKSKEVDWEGEAQNVKLELYQNNKKIADIAIVRSGHHYDWQLPKKAFTKGDNYKIKGSANGRDVYSEAFTLKNKLPVYVWIIPVAVAGGIYAIIKGLGGTTPEDNTIPPPPDPN